MRLTPNERNAIRKAIHTLHPNTDIYLFGSRTDDTQKGGDIDLFIDADNITLRDKLAIKRAIYTEIGEQKIDIVTVKPNNHTFITLIKKKAIKL